MTIKKDLKDIGYYLITPLPKKYHFEGVDNRRASRNLTIAAVTIQVGLVAAVLYGPIVMDAADRLVSKVKKTLKKND